METPARYRELAAECLRLVSMAKTEEHRKILREMAQAWLKVAEESGRWCDTGSQAGGRSIEDVSCSSS